MIARFRQLLLFGFLSITLTGCTLSLPFTAKKAGLQITATPQATVFIDGKHVGQTPYETNDLKAGEVTIKLVPEGQAGESWETKVTLTPKVVTIINREFGPTADQSSGEVLTLESLTKKDATSLVVLSTPDSSIVQVDGQPQGFAPLSLDSLSAGDHTVALSSPGFKDKSLKAKLPAGYKLTLNFQLARISIEAATDQAEATPSADLASPSPTPKA